jgi:hypothetical protein
MQLQAWRFMPPILLGYDKYRDPRLLRLAGDYALDWLEAHRNAKNSKKAFVWYDMAVAARATYLAYLVRAGGVSGVFDEGERKRVEPLLAGRIGQVEPIDATSQVVWDAEARVIGTLGEVLQPIFNNLSLKPGENEGFHAFDQILTFDICGVRVAVCGFSWRVDYAEAIHGFTIGNHDSIAELIIRSVDGTAPHPVDRVIYDTDMQGLTFDADGRVQPRQH